MTTYTITKEGRILWAGDYPSKEAALAAYRKDLGAEAFDYDAVDPDWINELEVDEAA